MEMMMEPVMMPARYRYLLHSFFTTMILGFALTTFVQCQTQSGWERTKPALSEGEYLIRDITVQYDSIHLFCGYGDFRLRGETEQAIEFVNYFDAGWDATASAISDASRSKPFTTTFDSELKFRRILGFGTENHSPWKVVRDTSLWMLEMHDAGNDELLGVIDSVGILPCRSSRDGETPREFGLNRHLVVNRRFACNLAEFLPEGFKGLVYLKIRLRHGPSALSCSIDDRMTKMEYDN